MNVSYKNDSVTRVIVSKTRGDLASLGNQYRLVRSTVKMIVSTGDLLHRADLPSLAVVKLGNWSSEPPKSSL